MPRIQVIAFDAVFTLIHPEPDALDVYQYYAEKYQLNLPSQPLAQRFRQAYQYQERYDQANGWHTDENRERQRWHNIIAHTLPGLPDGGRDKLYHHFAQPTSWTIDPSITDLLDDLGQHYTLVVASNFDHRLHSALQCSPILTANMSHTFLSSEIGHRKPSANFYDAMVKQLQCQADEVVMVGDDPGNDYSGAEYAGLQSILYDPLSRYETIPSRIRSLLELRNLMPAYNGDHP